MLDPRRWPWWGWVVAVVLTFVIAVFTGLLALRQHGLAELRLVVADIRGQDRGLVPADLIAQAPPVDRARQARLWALVGNGSGSWLDYRAATTYGMAARVAPAAQAVKRDADTATLLAASLADRESWRRLHREGPVVVSTLGWLREDVPDPANLGLVGVSALRIPNMLGLRALAVAFASEARTADDPRPALTELDALVAAQIHPGSLIDAMVLLNLSEVRDEAWLEAASRGIDPAPWIAQREDALARVGDSFACERLLFQGSLYQNAVAGSSLGGFYASYWPGGARGWVDAPLAWCYEHTAWATSPGEVAFILRCSLAAEDLCRTGVDRSGPFVSRLYDPWFRRLHPLASLSVPNYQECVITAVQSGTGARRLRIAGALAYGWWATGTLPADRTDPGFPSSGLLAAQAHGPEIRYERLSPTRFRLWTDPATPATDVLPAGRIVAPRPSTVPTAWENGRHWWLEMDLAGFPRPGDR